MVEREDGFRRLDELSPLDSGARERRSVEGLDLRRDALEPHGVGAVLDAGIDAMRARFVPVFGACVVLWIGPAWLTAYQSPEDMANALVGPGGDAYGFALLGATMLHTTLSAVVQILASILVAVLLRGEFVGETPTVGESATLVARRLPALIGCTILVGLASLGGFALCVLPYFYVLWRVSLAPIACAIEARGPMQSITRSFALTKGSFRRWAGIASVSAVLVLPLSAAAGAAATPEARDAALEDLSISPALYSAILWIAATLFFAAATATAAAISTSFYFDCRVRRDALDLEERLDEIAAGRGARTLA